MRNRRNFPTERKKIQQMSREFLPDATSISTDLFLRKKGEKFFFCGGTGGGGVSEGKRENSLRVTEKKNPFFPPFVKLKYFVGRKIPKGFSLFLSFSDETQKLEKEEEEEEEVRNPTPCRLVSVWAFLQISPLLRSRSSSVPCYCCPLSNKQCGLFLWEKNGRRKKN